MSRAGMRSGRRDYRNQSGGDRRGADMKHYNVDSGSGRFNSVRGHEFAGRIARGGRK